MRKNKIFGFTLAEVLITLGIIGVVAAMTIPTLMANIKGMRYRAQLKKALSSMNQAVKMNVAHYDYNWNDASVSCDNKTSGQNPAEVASKCAIMMGNMTGITGYGRLKNIIDGKTKQAYYKGITSAGDKPNFIDSYFASFSLADGTIVAFHYGIPDGNVNKPSNGFCTRKDSTKVDADFVNKHQMCIGFIDVNGTTLPNKEINCDDGNRFSENCIVSTKNLTDIYPIILLDDHVEPATAAAQFVFPTTK